MASQAANSAHFVFIPLMSLQGHLIPMVDTALLLASRGALCTIVVTPSSSAKVRPTVESAALPVRLAEFPLPPLDDDEGVADKRLERMPVELRPSNFRAMALLAPQVESHLRAVAPRPTCIVSDALQPWAAGLAVPRLSFFAQGAFYLLCQHNLERFNAYDGVGWNEAVVVPGLQERFEVTSAQAPGFFRRSTVHGTLGDDVERAVATADGFVINTFLEMEAEYARGYAAARGKKVWTVGPVSLAAGTPAAGRGGDSSVAADKCLRWLDDKEPGSVVYVSFGSIAGMDPRQAMELGLGLEASGQPFVWVVKGGDEFLRGLEARVAGRGLVVRGWAPQPLLLAHRAVGGFVTHCGWNSLLEAATAGLPVVTWPHYGDAFLNEHLAVEALGIGLRVGATEMVMYPLLAALPENDARPSAFT